MQIIDEVASQYGLAALMHEKPFAVSAVYLIDSQMLLLVLNEMKRR